MAEQVKRYAATPKGTFRTSSDPVPPQRSLRDALQTYGPYSPGVTASRMAMSPQRQSEWNQVQSQPDTLRQILQDQMLRNPQQTGMVQRGIDAYHAARSMQNRSPEEQRALLAAAGAMGGGGSDAARSTPPRDAALAAGMKGVTNTAHGIQGATMGMVNGKPVLIPAAGAANRAAFQSGIGELGLNPVDAANPEAVTWKQYQRESQRQTAEKGAEKRKLDNAIALQKVVNEGGVAKAEASGAAKASGQRRNEEKALRSDFSKSAGADYEQYQNAYRNAVRNADQSTRTDPKTTLPRKGPVTREAIAERLALEGLPTEPMLSAEQYFKTPYFQEHMRARYNGSIGTTPESVWKGELFNQIMGFPLQQSAPPLQQAEPLPAQPIAPNANAAPAGPASAPPPGAQVAPSAPPEANAAGQGAMAGSGAPVAPVADYVAMLGSNLSPRSPQDTQSVIAAAKALAQHGRIQDAHHLLDEAEKMGFKFSPS